MPTDKNTAIRIRISEEEKNDFFAVCDRNAVNASELIRKFIVQWTKAHKEETPLTNFSESIK